MMGRLALALGFVAGALWCAVPHGPDDSDEAGA